MNNLEPGQLVRLKTNRLWLNRQLAIMEIPEGSVGMILGFKKSPGRWVTYTIRVLFDEQIIITQGLKVDIDSIFCPIENT